MSFPYIDKTDTYTIVIYINDLTYRYSARRNFEYELATLKLEDINLVPVSSGNKSGPRGENRAYALKEQVEFFPKECTVNL
jgi:hypothetical protein